ncbi:MAG: hypothetical protein KJO44_03275 [Gemmatimonadetes bacterium]|nr:hypothetical protein [Gemmatimonadota bacterium]MBT8478830.1 hypothetical protein [Gemmatimonadota bacterium]NNK48379.1 hypothetical protein [Gemmatimonadota bacterium]
MTGRSRRSSIGCLVAVLLAAPGLHAQTAPDSALAAATARALEPGVRAALRTGQPAAFEHRSSWGETVKTRLEESLGIELTDLHRKGTGRILLGAPTFDADTAFIEVWFGRCESDGNAETLKIRMYSFEFQREAEDWSLLRSSRMGTTEGSCDGDWKRSESVQT